jgi:hypothetical protein
MSVSTKLITAEAFELMPDDGMVSELIRGEIVSVGPPARRHGRLTPGSEDSSPTVSKMPARESW